MMVQQLKGNPSYILGKINDAGVQQVSRPSTPK